MNYTAPLIPSTKKVIPIFSPKGNNSNPFLRVSISNSRMHLGTPVKELI